MNDVWIASWIDEKGRITVTAFNNEIEAKWCGKWAEESGRTEVTVDQAPVYSKFMWDRRTKASEKIPMPKETTVTKKTREYTKIFCCGDCINYNWKKHKCKRGASIEGKPVDRFFRDCPNGLYEEEVTNK